MLNRQKLELVKEEIEENEDNIIVSETPVPERGPCPDPPDYLSWEAKQVWLEAAPDLWAKDRLHGGTITLLINFCRASGMVAEMEAMLEVDGKIVKGKQHPGLKIMWDAMTQVSRYGVELRFAREHINNSDMARENGWESGLLA